MSQKMAQEQDDDYGKLKTTIPTWIMHSKEQFPLHHIFIMHRTTEALQKLRVAPLLPPFKLPENTQGSRHSPVRGIQKYLDEPNWTKQRC